MDKESPKLPSSLWAERRHMEGFKVVHLSTSQASTTLHLPARVPAKAGHHSSCGPTSFFPADAPSLKNDHVINSWSTQSSLWRWTFLKQSSLCFFSAMCWNWRGRRCLTILVCTDARQPAKRCARTCSFILLTLRQVLTLSWQAPAIAMPRWLGPRVCLAPNPSAASAFLT